MVVATVQDGELRIRAVNAVIAEIQDMLAPYRREGGGSEALMRDRRKEAAQEESEYQANLVVRRS